MKRAMVLVLLGAAWAASDAIDNRQPAIADGPDAVTIPRLLSYQGKLTDTNGNAVPDTTYSVAFRLYTVPSGGTQFWTETQTVRTKSGLFSALLGSVTPIGSMPDAGGVYLGMSVAGGAELTPRLRIASSAYAYLAERAANADLLQGRDTTTFSRSTHNHDAAYVNEGQANSVTSTMIADATVAAADLSQMGAGTGQVMKWTGSAWAPRNDSVGQGGTGDNAWVRVGGDSVLYTVHRLGLARGEAGNALHGTYRHSHVNFGVSCTTGVSCQNYSNLTVGGGIGNVVGAAFSTIAGGLTNRAIGIGAAVGGGAGNVAGDAVSDTAATVAGGQGNRAAGAFATVGGGQNDTASGDWATVGGGEANVASGDWATVSGGDEDSASGTCSTVGGGHSNAAGGYASTIAGGLGISASGSYASVGGGQVNRAETSYTTIGGGYFNLASGYAGTVGGGYLNGAHGNYATVPGGHYSRAVGRCSFAAGTYARANHANTFVWNDSVRDARDSLCTTGSNQWLVSAQGGAWFYSNLLKTTGAYLAPGSNAWASACDSSTKEDFREVDRRELLQRVAALRVRNYKMRDQDDGTRHIGPVAQDFAAAFGVGENSTSINMADADGVLLAAVQALYEQNQLQQAEIEALKAALTEGK